MKNRFYKLYTAVFFGICLLPALCTPFLQTSDTAEKRSLSTFPKLMRDDGSLNENIFSDFDTWFSEHFAFRSRLVTADSRLRAATVKTSPNADVIIGKNGWLYYAETVDDFLRIDTFSEREMKNIAHNLRLVDEYCRERGAEFIFFSAPNKNSLYPEYMPYNYIPTAQPGNYELLTAELANDSFYFDMRKGLAELESPTPLYHKTDTHWNNFGAYAAHTMLMRRLGREICGTAGEWYIRCDRLGDLAAMIFPAEGAKDMQLHNDYQFRYGYTSHFRGPDDVLITTENSDAEGRLLMFRDSYGEAIFPYMAEVYAQAEFSRAVPYDLRSVAAGDTVITEIVERNLGDLQKYAPVMPAPCRDISISDAEKYVVSADINCRSSNGSTHVYGLLSEDIADSSELCIYAAVNGRYYEAFNCFEDKLPERGGERSSIGFSLYIPADITAEDIQIIAMR